MLDAFLVLADFAFIAITNIFSYETKCLIFLKSQLSYMNFKLQDSSQLTFHYIYKLLIMYVTAMSHAQIFFSFENYDFQWLFNSNHFSGIT